MITSIPEWDQLSVILSPQCLYVFDPHHLPDSEDKLSDYGVDKILELTDFYGTVQKVQYNGWEGISQLDIEAGDTEAGWKLFRRFIFTRCTSSIPSPVKADRPK